MIVQTNNPLNIRRTRTEWRGMADRQIGEFVCFVNEEFGLRAGFIILDTYITKYHLRTIRQIITRWAPPTENDTENYISYVCLNTDMDPDTPYAWDDKQRINLIKAMCMMESGTRASPIQLKTAMKMG